MREITSEIIEPIAVLSESDTSGWRKELNVISWNGRPPVYDIRSWSPEHDRSGRGVTLTDKEMNVLTAAMQGRKGGV